MRIKGENPGAAPGMGALYLFWCVFRLLGEAFFQFQIAISSGAVGHTAVWGSGRSENSPSS